MPPNRIEYDCAPTCAAARPNAPKAGVATTPTITQGREAGVRHQMARQILRRGIRIIWARAPAPSPTSASGSDWTPHEGRHLLARVEVVGEHDAGEERVDLQVHREPMRGRRVRRVRDGPCAGRGERQAPSSARRTSGFSTAGYAAPGWHSAATIAASGG